MANDRSVLLFYLMNSLLLFKGRFRAPRQRRRPDGHYQERFHSVAPSGQVRAPKRGPLVAAARRPSRRSGQERSNAAARGSALRPPACGVAVAGQGGVTACDCEERAHAVAYRRQEEPGEGCGGVGGCGCFCCGGF